ncbi:MAG: hypothetical protein M3Z30_02780, partial [Gemmatimonadota bacterium]|nr:hypothetical protein [Gemmatimonadota bacterium]
MAQDSVCSKITLLELRDAANASEEPRVDSSTPRDITKSKVNVFKTAFATYKQQRIVGEGGSGRVYEATDESGSRFAIKVLDAKKATREKRKRFQNEIFVGRSNRHPQVVRILDHGIIEVGETDALFYVMPLYDSTLRGLLGANHDGSKLLSLF